jgi:uncharacterized protein YuzE
MHPDRPRKLAGVRVSYDRTENTARIRLTDYADADVARWKTLVEHDVEGEFTFDFDKSGKLLGVEVKFASQGLPADFLEAADAG